MRLFICYNNRIGSVEFCVCTAYLTRKYEFDREKGNMDFQQNIDTYARDISCIPQITLRPPNLSGKGVIIAVLDSGERVIIMSS